MEEIILLGALDDNEDDDVDDAVILHILNDNENLGNRGVLYGPFNVNEMFEIECVKLFRFKKRDILRLLRGLGIPDRIVTNLRVTVTGEMALCILLRRLAYPNRLSDLESLFGLSASAISSVINHMINLILAEKGPLLDNLSNLHYLNYQKLIQFAQAISNKGSPVPNCWGFIDGTARAICRPTVDQENYYSGHKKFHCVKYQSVISPDGIICSLKGAYPGRRHDAGIFRESGLYAELEENVVFRNENQHFVLYGDQAYSLRELLLRPYYENEIIGHPERQIFNNAIEV